MRTLAFRSLIPYNGAVTSVAGTCPWPARRRGKPGSAARRAAELIGSHRCGRGLFLPGMRTTTHTTVAGAGVLLGLAYLGTRNYLLFHTVAEMATIVVACGIFVIAWNSRRFAGNGYLLFVGLASLFVGMLDLVHALAFKGMGVFPGHDANLPTQLWIAARSLEAVSLLVAPYWLRRQIPWAGLLALYAAITTALLLSVFLWPVFPTCYVEGSGLTPFKRNMEYAICLVLAAAAALLIRERRQFDDGILRLLVGALAATIGTELVFTTYIGVYDAANLVGHLLKVVAFALYYAAIIETSFRRPYSLLLRELKSNEDALRRSEAQAVAYADQLAQTNERLEAANDELQAQSDELQAQTDELQAQSEELHATNDDLAAANEAERRARKEAQDANEAKDQFVALVSHELRNPLGAIQSGVYLLRQSCPVEGRAARAMEIVERNARLQARLVDDLLDLSRLERGKMEIHPAPVPLEKVVTAACQAYEGEVREAGLSLACDCDPALWVHGDFDRLEQVVLNLLSNAAKFTPAGGRIEVRSGRADETSGRLGEWESGRMGTSAASGTESLPFPHSPIPPLARIVVEDTGIGMDQTLLDNLFEMFHQGQVAGQRRPGLGIGLALVKGIVERHGGRVWAESEGAGKGSRFIVQLPLVEAPATDGERRK